MMSNLLEKHQIISLHPVSYEVPMKIRDQLANDITSAIQSYINRYSKYNDIPEDRKRDIQNFWLILQEKKPAKLRKRIEQKLNEMPSGIMLFFMFDLKKLKYPILEVISQDKYQKTNLKICYEKELSVSSGELNREDILHLVERINQLEMNVTKYEQRTQNLELEVGRLTKENSFLTQKIQELHDKNKKLDQERNDAVKRAENAENKLQTMEDKYTKLLEENKQLKDRLNSLQKKSCKPMEYLDSPRISLSSCV